ncbi:unnamed protein product [Prorocentrum cordatum]|uniref:Reverse transcriptase Ty1/copia-type domain-containing protein n=1 Tax=Prorocentrum cordatum TaxID=2364126 RepID=A0ABN9VZI6_9DINO|nr:unnamed protein product [Polarella glacialis]
MELSAEQQRFVMDMIDRQVEERAAADRQAATAMIEQERARFNEQLQASTQQNNQMAEQLRALEQARQQQQAAFQALQAQQEPQQQGPGRQADFPNSADDKLVDIKFGKLGQFTNKDEDFEEWSFKLKSGISSLSEEACHLMDSIEDDPETDVTNDPDIARYGLETLSEKLYFALVMLSKATAAKIVKKVSSKNGFEAYRQLVKRHGPCGGGKTVALMGQIRDYTFGEPKDFLDNLVSWEALIDQRGTEAEEKLADSVKCSTLILKSPKILKDHLLLTTKKEKDYGKLRAKVEDYMHNVVNAKPKKKGEDQDAMDVGYTAKTPKAVSTKVAKAKEKDGKSKSSDGKGKDGKSKSSGSKGKDGKSKASGGKGKGTSWYDSSWQRGSTWSWKDRSGWNDRSVNNTWTSSSGSWQESQPADAGNRKTTNKDGTVTHIYEDEDEWIMGVEEISGEEFVLSTAATKSEVRKYDYGNIGDAVDVLSDSGSSVTCCNPRDFPKSPIIQGDEEIYRTSKGTVLKFYGYKDVVLRKDSTKIKVKFTVLDVVRPILSVSDSAKKHDISTHYEQGNNYMERRTSTGVRRLGLMARAGLFFLQAMVTAGSSVRFGKSQVHHVYNNEGATELDLGPESAVVPHPAEAAPVVPAPAEPTQQERDHHIALNHAQFKSWCKFCVSGRGRENAHHKADEIDHNIARVQVDYFFMRRVKAGQMLTCLSAVDSVHRRRRAAVLDAKGSTDKYAVRILKYFGDQLGYEKIIWRTDPESAAADLIRAACHGRDGWTYESSPKESKGSLGLVERTHQDVEGLTRTILLDVESRYGVELPAEFPLIEWIVRHIAWLMDRFWIAPGAGVTPFELQYERQYHSPMVPFAETVMWKEPGPHTFKLREKFGQGIWVGRSEATNCHLILTRQGAFEARTIRRFDRPTKEPGHYPLQRFWASQQLHQHPQHRVQLSQVNVGKQYVQFSQQSLSHQEFTPGCSGCLGTSYKHSKFCKERNKEFFEHMEIDKLATKVQRDDERELLRSIERAEKASKVQQGASAAAPSSGSLPSSSTDPPQPPSGDAGAMNASHIYNLEVNWIFDTIRHPDNFTKEFIQEVFTKYHAACHVNEEEHFMKDLLDDPNEVDFGDHLDYDEDDGEALDPGQVKEGIQRELDMMRDLDVGEPVRRDEIATGTKIWTTRWCLRKKAGGVRARLVVRQYKWIAGKSDDNFAPTPGIEGIRLLIAVGLVEGADFITGDFSVAFMHTELDEEIYVWPPPEMGLPSGTVLRLKEALNGLQNASKLFSEKVQRILKEELGFRATRANPVILYNERSSVKVAIHVDDPLGIGQEKQLGKRLKFRVGVKFGPEVPCVFLGCSYLRFGDTVVEMPKKNYFENTLKAMGIEKCVKVTTPGSKEWFSTKALDSQDATPLDREEHHKFRQGVGKLQYGVDKRFDYSYELKLCERRLHAPRAVDMSRLKRILRYVKGTLDYVITLSIKDTSDLKRLVGTSDSDWAGDPESRKSSSDLGYPVDNVIETDSSSGKSITLRRGRGRVRHLDVRALWLQQLVAARAVQILKIPGAENRADVGTKLLDARTLRRHLQSLGMRRFVNGELLDIEDGDTEGENEVDLVGKDVNHISLSKAMTCSISGSKRFIPCMLLVSNMAGAKGADPTSMSPIITTNFDSFYAFVMFTFLAGVRAGLLTSKSVACIRGCKRPVQVGHVSSTQGPSPHSATDATPDKQGYIDPPASVYRGPKRAATKIVTEDLKQWVYITSEYSQVYHTRGTCRSIKNLNTLRHLRICEFCHHDD